MLVGGWRGCVSAECVTTHPCPFPVGSAGPAVVSCRSCPVVCDPLGASPPPHPGVRCVYVQELPGEPARLQYARPTLSPRTQPTVARHHYHHVMQACVLSPPSSRPRPHPTHHTTIQFRSPYCVRKFARRMVRMPVSSCLCSALSTCTYPHVYLPSYGTTAARPWCPRSPWRLRRPCLRGRCPWLRRRLR